MAITEYFWSGWDPKFKTSKRLKQKLGRDNIFHICYSEKENILKAFTHDDT